MTSNDEDVMQYFLHLNKDLAAKEREQLRKNKVKKKKIKKTSKLNICKSQHKPLYVNILYIIFDLFWNMLLPLLL